MSWRPTPREALVVVSTPRDRARRAALVALGIVVVAGDVVAVVLSVNALG